MENEKIENVKAQMRKGVLEYCILTIMNQQDCYATDILRKLKDARLIVVEGTLYPLLTRQKNAGLLSYRWEESPQGPPRKYYMLTDAGREFLKDLDSSWEDLVKAVALINQQS
jgi:PadR family transcriptional regulator PadR